MTMTLDPAALPLPRPTSHCLVALRKALSFSLNVYPFKTRRTKLADARRWLPPTNPHSGSVLLSCHMQLSDASWSGLTRSKPGWRC